MSNARTFANSLAGFEGVLKEFKAIGEIYIAEGIDISIHDREQSYRTILDTSIWTRLQFTNFGMQLFVAQRNDIDLVEEGSNEVRWMCNLTLSCRHGRCAFLQCAYTDDLDCKYLCRVMRCNCIGKRLNIIRSLDGAYENPDTLRSHHGSKFPGSLLKDRETFLATAHEMIEIYKEQPTDIY